MVLVSFIFIFYLLGSTSSPVTPKSKSNASGTRRQLHVISEQKRRKNLKEGFDDLTLHVPTCREKTSKVEVLHKAVEYIQYLKKNLEKVTQEHMELKVQYMKLAGKQGVDMSQMSTSSTVAELTGSGGDKAVHGGGADGLHGGVGLVNGAPLKKNSV